MTNWFYMNRQTFQNLLRDELGANLTSKLISIDFDTPVSFMIGETSNEILLKIQQTLSRHFCRKLICTDQCLSCSLSPPNYAKLIWFVQRLSIMSPLAKPFIKQIVSNDKSINDDCNFKDLAIVILLLIIVTTIFIAIFY